MAGDFGKFVVAFLFAAAHEFVCHDVLKVVYHDDVFCDFGQDVANLFAAVGDVDVAALPCCFQAALLVFGGGLPAFGAKG